MLNWDQLNEHKLTVYATKWCPDCRRLQLKLKKHDIDYLLVDIDENPLAAKRLKYKTGHKTIPYIEVNNQRMIPGWHENEIDRFNDERFLRQMENAVTN